MFLHSKYFKVVTSKKDYTLQKIGKPIVYMEESSKLRQFEELSHFRSTQGNKCKQKFDKNSYVKINEN